MCNALAKKLNLTGTAYVTEVARHVMKSKGYTRDDVGSLKMQEDILNAHLDLEETGENSSAIRLWDRSAIDAIVYAILTSPNDEEARRRQEYLTRSAKFQRVLRHYLQSTFILLGPVEEWLVDDGVRSMDNQTECLLIYRKLLSELGITYQEVGPEMKELAERVVFTMGLAKL